MMKRAALLAFAVATATVAQAEEVASGLAALNSVCKARIKSGDYEDALRVCKRVRFDAEKMAPGSPQHIESLVNLGDIKMFDENYVDADAYYTSALEWVERATEPSKEPGATDVPTLLATLVELKVKRGRLAEAEPLLKRALELQEKSNAPASKVAVIQARYADLLADGRQFLEAEEAYKQAISVLERSGPSMAQGLMLALQGQGEMYERRAMLSHAEMSYRRLLELAVQGTPGNPQLITALDRLADICEQQGRPAEAKTLYQREMAALLAGPGVPMTAANRVRSKLADLDAANGTSAAGMIGNRAAIAGGTGTNGTNGAAPGATATPGAAVATAAPAR